VTDALNQLNLVLAQNETVATLWMQGMGDRASLSDLERERFDALLRAYMHICDTMYYQAQVGAGDNGLWLAEERYLAVILNSPGGRAWFEENTASISAGFLEALHDVIRRQDALLSDELAVRYNKMAVSID
jgi:hypothetical protein